MTDSITLEERLARHLGAPPHLEDAAFIAGSATVIGDVRLGVDASVWYGVVMRADINSIRIGASSNVQDGTIVHLSNDHGVEIGERVTVGHRAIVHACRIDDECLIGMGATVLDGARIGTQTIIGANSLVPLGMEIPPGSLVFGAPARVVRPLTEGEKESIPKLAFKYVEVARAHRRLMG
jgi:gamma-carbonic anhydrase